MYQIIQVWSYVFIFWVWYQIFSIFQLHDDISSMHPNCVLAIKASQIERKCRQKKVKLVCIKTSVFTCFQNSATYISTIHSNSILNPLLSNLPFSFAPTSHLFLSSLYLHSTTELNSILFLPNVNEPKYAYPYHRQGSWQNT